MSQVFAIFSNTLEEYEAFIKCRVFYWPREISKLTPYQKELSDIKTREEIGDKIAIVVGANLKGIKDGYLKDHINDTPMITHIGEVVEVYNRPVLGYRYTHGKKPSPSFMLPFELLPQLKEMDEYLGKKFSNETIEEIEQAILFGNKITSLLASSDIEFTRAYFKKNRIFIDSENEDEVYELTNNFPLHKKRFRN